MKTKAEEILRKYLLNYPSQGAFRDELLTLAQSARLAGLEEAADWISQDALSHRTDTDTWVFQGNPAAKIRAKAQAIRDEGRREGE